MAESKEAHEGKQAPEGNESGGTSRDESKEARAEQLLHRAISAVYQVLIREMDAFAARHSAAFRGARDEHRLEWTALFREFEAIMEQRLQELVRNEGLSGPAELVDAVAAVSTGDERGAKLLELLLAGTTYARFVKVMRRKVAPT
jgi:hypothetical protein